MTRIYDHRADLDWDQLTAAEQRDEICARASQALQPFYGRPLWTGQIEAIERTLRRVEAVIALEERGLRRDVAEAMADGN